MLKYEVKIKVGEIIPGKSLRRQVKASLCAMTAAVGAGELAGQLRMVK